MLGPLMEDTVMNKNDMNEYDGYPKQELIVRDYIAAMERARREREEKAKRYILELEGIVLHQPNDFAD